MTQSSTLFQRRPIFFWLALLVWVAITLLLNALFWIDLVNDFADVQISCTGVPGVFNDCNFAALTPPEVGVWTSWGLSLPVYAAVMVSGAVFTFLVYTALAGLLLWQQGRSWMGLTISLALIAIPYTMNAASRDFAALNPDLAWPNAVASALGNGIVLLFLYLVPNGRFSPRWAYIPMILTLLYAVGGLGQLVTGQFSPPDPIVSFLNVAVVALVVFGGSLQVYRYLYEANSVERQQTKWIIFGVVIFVTAIISWVLVFGRVLPIADGRARIIANIVGMLYADFFALPFLPVAITIAILRYRLWGIDVIIRRTLLYGILSGSLALVYFGTVVLLQRLFGTVNAQQSPLIIVVSTLTIAALFTPLRRRVQTFIDRRLYRRKYDAQQVLARFAHTAGDETELASLTDKLLGVVQETIQPEQVSVWLKPGSGKKRPQRSTPP